MRVIAIRTLRDFWLRHPESESELRAWYMEACHADWKTPIDIKARYRSASILRRGRVVFNIGGNKYRLIVAINFPYSIVYIRFIGTHAEYDRIDAETV